MNFYAVLVGRKPGVYDNWPECAKQIINYRGAHFKKFRTKTDAEKYIQNNTNIENVNFYLSNKKPIPSPLSKNVAFLDIEDSDDEENNTLTIINKIYNPSFKASYYVYCHGVYKNNRTGIGIYFIANDTRNKSMEILDCFSNYEAELNSLIITYNIIRQNLLDELNVVIVTDSKYSVKCLTTLGYECEKNKWRTKIPNKKLIKEAYDLFKNHENVRFLINSKNDEKHAINFLEARRMANLSIGLIV